MEWLFIIGCVIALIVISSSQGSLRRDVNELQKLVFKLRQELAALNAPAEPEEPAPAAPVEKETASEPVAPAPILQPAVTTPAEGPPVTPAPETGSGHSFEQQFGGRAFVWIGGVALALAGFFMVKYSIEMGFVTETVRIILGLGFGAALIVASLAVRAMKTLADGTRIAQALAGAGIADLYGSLFAATTLYHLLPTGAGFAAMAAVTAMALVMSLRFGSPIAVLGLVGGYATPALIHGEPNTPLLFGYLYIVCAGLTAVARGRGWWWLSAPALAVAYGWVVAWLLLGYGPGDSFWISLFLVAIALTSAAAGNIATDEETAWPRLAVLNLAPAGALILMGALTYSTAFGLFEWSMYAVLSLWALLLARFDWSTYRAVPWLAMAANIAMLAMWTGRDPVFAAMILGGFAALFAAVPQMLIWRSKRPVFWALVSAVAAVAYFLLAYAKLDSTLVAQIGKEPADYVWSGIAAAAAAVFALATALAYVLSKEERTRHLLQATYTAAATALTSVALAILLDMQYLPLAFTAEVFVLSWLARGLAIPALRPVAMVLTGAFLLLSIGPLVDVFNPDMSTGLQTVLANTLYRLLLPAVLLGAAMLNWRKVRDDKFVQFLEFLTVLLVGAFLYRVLTAALAGYDRAFGLMTAAIRSGALLLWAVIVAWTGRISHRDGPPAAAALLAIIAGLYIFNWHFIIANPLLTHRWVGEYPFLNGLLAAYAAPALLYALLARALPWRGGATSANIAAYGLLIVWALLAVRQLFHGAYLDGAIAGNAELYGYSAAGLVAGILLLLLGVARRDPATRVASLVVMMLTVAKVFLFDASELTGLWRVVSFLGLGFSLLALSWFYSRFVFKTRAEKD